MGIPRANEALAQQLQEDRLAKLCDDNAFVNVSEVLCRQRRDGTAAGAGNLEADFLEPSEALVKAPPRIHISRILLEQHRAYLKALEEEEQDEEDRCCRKRKENDALTSEGLSFTSAASAEYGALDSVLESDKRTRVSDRKKDARRGFHYGSHRNKNDESSGSCIDFGSTQAVIHAERECQNIRLWCRWRQAVESESKVLMPSYTAMTAPPSAHVGGYHLCSICLLPAAYKCVRCQRMLFCSIDCHVVHDATRVAQMLGVKQLNGAAFFTRVLDSSIIREDLLSQNVPRQLSALQQILAFMTIGRDMSSYFSDVAPLCSSTDLTIKRLVYLYLMHNSRARPERAVLQAGTFVKDTLNDSPLIRGAALRTMTSLLIPIMVDFITLPLLRCLEDSDPYVRCIAVFGTLKLYCVAPNVCEEVGLLEKIKDQLQYENAYVMASAVVVILELRHKHAPTFLYEALVENVFRILAAANETTGWYQQYLLEGVGVVLASGGNEVVSDVDKATRIVEGVLPFLSSFNVATVMAAVRVVAIFLFKTFSRLSSSDINTDDTSLQLLQQLQDSYAPRVVSSCVSLLYKPFLEVRFVTLRIIRLLIMTGFQRFFKKHLGVFFVKFDDPIYIKLEKITLLLELADTEVGELVLSEYVTYTTDMDEELARKAVRSIGLLAVNVEPLSEQCVKRLSALIDVGANFILQDVAVVMQTILRRYPGRFISVVAKLCGSLSELSTSESKAAVVWALGEYADTLENAYDFLDMFLDSYSSELQVVQLALLTAVVKIYLRFTAKTAQRASNNLQQVLDMAKKSPHPDVRDRAFMYWRLVSTDREAAKKLVLGSTKSSSYTTISKIERHRLQNLVLQIGNFTSVLQRPLHLVLGCGTRFAENDEDDDERNNDCGDDFANESTNVRGHHTSPALPEEDVNSAVRGDGLRAFTGRVGEAMQLVLTAKEGNGLEVRMCWSQIGSKLLLKCHLSLLPGADYVRHVCIRMLQINRNMFALDVAQEWPFVVLESGQRESDVVTLLMGTNNEKTPTRDLYVAINAEPIGTRYFLAPPVPPAMLLLPATGSDVAGFAKQFQELKGPSWTMPPSVTPVRTEQTRFTANSLRVHGLNLVYSGGRSEEGNVCLFLSAETIAAQKLLIEVIIEHDSVVYLGVRCKDACISHVFGTYTLEILTATGSS